MKNKPPMTSRQLARLIGVSQSAISRAFSPGASISPDLKQRILAAADAYGYSPNVIASILSTRRSNIVGIVISNLTNPFFPALLDKLSHRLQAHGQQSLLFNIAPGGDVKQQLAAIRQYNVDAVIVISATVLSGPALNWATEGRSAVLFNRVAPDSGLASVCCDNVHGARLIADHFHALGHRRVAYVAGLAHTNTNEERRSGFITRVAELGMTLTANAVAGDYSYGAGYRTALEICRDGRPDAIFFANDVLAAGGMDALRESAGLAVPDDISICGFDDIGMASWPRYDLTTCRQPIDDMIDLTIRLIEQGGAVRGAATKTHLLKGDLISRGSTKSRG